MSGRWLRHIPHGAGPLHRPAPAGDNRWQRGDVVDALYLVKDEAGLWAEWYRHLAERGIPPLGLLPRDVWIVQVAPLRVANLTDAERLRRVGLELPHPGRRTWSPYQEVGEQLAREGWAGLVAPSAARPRSLVLCVFLPGHDVPRQLSAAPPPTVVEDPPVVPTGMRT